MTDETDQPAWAANKGLSTDTDAVTVYPAVDQKQAWQQAADDLYRKGDRNYWKSHFYNELSDAFIDTLMEYVDPLPSPLTTLYFEWLGGAIAEPDNDATAFPHRDKTFMFTISPKWEDAERDAEMIEWAQEFHEALAPYAADGVYVNYIDQDEGDRVREAYEGRYERLQELKTEWDPDNLFRMNQNIEPTE